MKLYVIFWGLLQVKRVLLSRSFDLEEFIPKDYDRFIPPKTSEDEAVNVTVSLYVIQIRSVDETNMNFKIDILIRQQWKDHRLNFPSVIGTKKVVIDPSWRSEMWTPDVWFKNALDTKLQEWEVPMVFYWLEKENVCFSGRVTLELSCDMEMHRYPHDTQTCGVDIMALMDSMTDLNLQWKKDHPIRLSKILTLPQFEVTNVTDTRCDSIMYGEMFSCIRAAFTLIRRGGYFLINIYIPTVLIVAMSMLTFWIPPEAVPARITLGVTSLLTIITKQYQASMPNVSYVVAMNIWLSCCVAFVFCSLLEYGIVLSISEKNKNKVTVIPENADGDKPQDDKSVRKSFKAAWKAKTCTYFENRSAHYLDVISRFAFPIFFALFCIAYCGKYSY